MAMINKEPASCMQDAMDWPTLILHQGFGVVI